MNTKKATKRALLTSVMALVMCVVMLVGTTFAWFTDTASTGVNKITSGNLHVEIQDKEGKEIDTLKWVDKDGNDIANQEDILWEPGCTYLLTPFKIANTGNLALKYKIVITGLDGDADLLKVINFTYTTEGGETFDMNAEGHLTANGTDGAATKLITVTAEMDKLAGNEYKEKTLENVKFTVLATQDTVENDSFDNQYDKDAPYEIVKVSDEKELRYALCNAPTDGSGAKIVLQSDITLEMLYAAENFGTVTLPDNAEGDTFNRYKRGVHPSEDNPGHWNKLVTDQTSDERVLYGAYYHTGANDERIDRLVVKENQDVIIDLNGHTIAKNERATQGAWGGNVSTDLIANYGKLRVTDGTETVGVLKGNGFFSCGGAVLHNYGGTMIVEKVKVDGNAEAMANGSGKHTGQYVIVNDGGSTVIDGANVYDTHTDVDASLVVNTAGTMTIKGNAVLNHPNTKNINVKGGEVFVESATITSDNHAIYAKGGTVTVTDSGVTYTGAMTEAGGTIAHK